MTLEVLRLENKPTTFLCPFCFRTIKTRKKSWVRMKCPYCKSYIYRDKVEVVEHDS